MKDRNYGIDLLKILSMFFVIIIHVCGHGGLNFNGDNLSLNGVVVWLVRILVYCAVNMFALVTGYLCINKKFKYRNVINLWINVLFYNVIFTLLFGTLGRFDIFKSFFPVSNNIYWYFSSYFGFIFFIPFVIHI